MWRVLAMAVITMAAILITQWLGDGDDAQFQLDRFTACAAFMAATYAGIIFATGGK